MQLPIKGVGPVLIRVFEKSDAVNWMITIYLITSC